MESKRVGWEVRVRSGHFGISISAERPTRDLPEALNPREDGI